MEDDTCISMDGDGTWAFAMLHSKEFLEIFGVVLCAMWLTPSGISLSGFLEEFLG
jgi:hypothetical protein